MRDTCVGQIHFILQKQMEFTNAECNTSTAKERWKKICSIQRRLVIVFLLGFGFACFKDLEACALPREYGNVFKTRLQSGTARIMDTSNFQEKRTQTKQEACQFPKR